MCNLPELRRMVWTWSTLLGLLLPPLALLPASAAATGLEIAPPPPPAPPAHLVRELLEEDAKRALINERLSNASKAAAAGETDHLPLPTARPPRANESGVPAAESPEPTAIHQPVTRLKGIVGVGGRLSAIVSVDGKEAIYRSGQPLPAIGHDSGLRLVRIAAPCVEFSAERNATTRRISACLNEAQHEVSAQSH